MKDKRAPGRSLDEWMKLVTECRQSGLTDAAWCNEHGISPSCFYNAVTRLRKVKASIILGIRNYFIVNAIFFSSSSSHPTVKVHIPVWYPLRMIAVAVPW